MTKLILTFLLSTFLHCANAQSPYINIKLEEKSDFELAEHKVLEASKLLFTTKYDKDDLGRLYAIEFIVKWMTGTPDYTFELNETVSKAFANDTDLLSMYMAAMVKCALENKANVSNTKLIALNAAKMLIEYSNKASNNIKQSGELKKMSAALKKGELDKYLGMK